jgi:hypothetical protein
MNRMKNAPVHRYLPLLVVACLGLQPAFGQNEEDALRFSNLLPGGTARSWALGGAMGAVGADPGSATTNPAGFGLYNTSELSFSPQFEANTAKANFYGTDATDDDYRFSFGNLALILSYPDKDGGEWRSGVFGISFDRQASYHWDEHAMGHQVPSTILQKFVNEANGTTPSSLADVFPFSSDLAYETYAIDPLDTSAHTYSSAIPFGSPVDQDHRISTSGRLNTTSFFYAANFADKLYLGASLGLTGLRYQRTTVHQETSLDTALDLRNLKYQEELLTTGSGVDLKIGVLGRVGKYLRLGVAFHSPKWLQLSDGYNYTMTTGFRTPDASGNYTYGQTSPDGVFNYRLRTPWSVLASAAFIAGQHGLVSVDYSYTDFRQAKLNKSLDGLDDYDFSTENTAARNSFRSVSSLRVGTEWRSGQWYFRGGWGIWPDAYADDDKRQGTAYMRFTAGVGYRAKHISIDLAGVHGTRDINYFVYDPDLVQATQERQMDSRGILTFTYRP